MSKTAPQKTELINVPDGGDERRHLRAQRRSRDDARGHGEPAEEQLHARSPSVTRRNNDGGELTWRKGPATPTSAVIDAGSDTMDVGFSAIVWSSLCAAVRAVMMPWRLLVRPAVSIAPGLATEPSACTYHGVSIGILRGRGREGRTQDTEEGRRHGGQVCQDRKKGCHWQLAFEDFIGRVDSTSDDGVGVARNRTSERRSRTGQRHEERDEAREVHLSWGARKLRVETMAVECLSCRTQCRKQTLGLHIYVFSENRRVNVGGGTDASMKSTGNSV
jgi:hypothetical protein